MFGNTSAHLVFHFGVLLSTKARACQLTPTPTYYTHPTISRVLTLSLLVRKNIFVLLF